MRTTRAGESLLLLLDIIDLLCIRKAPVRLWAPFAASLYGAVPASIDADLSSGASDASSLEQDFPAAGFQTQLTGGDGDDPGLGLLGVRDG